MGLEAVADELYGLTPDEFVSARNARMMAARAEGDRDLAEQIKGLRRPTVAAWLANQLTRRNRDAVDDLLGLGEQLRQAMAAPNGPALRTLHAQQRELIQDLLQQGHQIAATAGHQVSDQVEQDLANTLHAALADPEAGQALASGHLIEALSVPAFSLMPREPVGPPPAPPSADTPASEAPSTTSGHVDSHSAHEDAARLQQEAARLHEEAVRLQEEAARAARLEEEARLQEEAARAARLEEEAARQHEEAARAARIEGLRLAAREAQEEVADARRTLAHATAALERATARARSARDLEEQLRAELAEASASRETAQRNEAAAQSSHDAAEAAVQEAEQRLREAQSAQDDTQQ